MADIRRAIRCCGAASPKRTLVVAAAFVVYGSLQRGTKRTLVRQLEVVALDQVWLVKTPHRS
jgi:hypothetical protein